MNRVRVGVVFGGRSPEHDVSIQTARSIITALDANDVECVPVYIERSGQWRSGMSLDALVIDACGDRSLAVADVEGHSPVAGLPAVQVTSSRSLIVPADIDVFIPAIHGVGGEDGSLQGLFELADVAYVGAGILGSAVGLDKIMMKQALTGAGFAVVDYLAFSRARWENEPDAVLTEVERRIAYPVFAKAATSGSSIGVTLAQDRLQLADAIADAAHYGRRLLVERAVSAAREIEVAILGNDSPNASVCGEVRPLGAFYDYVAKYHPGDAELIIPADIPEPLATTIRETAISVFTALDCSGMARVDFFYEPSAEKVWVNEINTIPGFTQTSMFPKLWAASGLDYATLLRKIIILAQERYGDRQRKSVST